MQRRHVCAQYAHDPTVDDVGKRRYGPRVGKRMMTATRNMDQVERAMVLDEELREVWNNLSPELEPVGPSLNPSALTQAWADCHAQLASTFAQYMGQKQAEARFSVPRDYVLFMTTIGGGWVWPLSLVYTLNRAESVARVTQTMCELFADERQEGSGLWLTIGHWSDKHDHLLCCDRTDARFGHVVDAHDDHPWLDGTGANYFPQLGASFVDYLRSRRDHVLAHRKRYALDSPRRARWRFW